MATKRTGKKLNRGGAPLTGQKVRGHQTMSGTASKNQFAGVGMPKAPRRSNGGRPRKMYPYVRKDQKGTQMETMINKNYDELERQWNAANRGRGRMSADDATGRLGGHWGNVKKFGTKGRAISDYIGKNGGSVKSAKSALMARHDVSFGADPKQK